VAGLAAGQAPPRAPSTAPSTDPTVADDIRLLRTACAQHDALRHDDAALDRYATAVEAALEGRRLDGLRVVVDCAHGADSVEIVVQWFFGTLMRVPLPRGWFMQLIAGG
jgi:hypothetical protein